MNSINTTTDLLNAAAQALEERDEDTLLRLFDVVEGWLISDQEASALKAVLSSMLEAAYFLNDV